LHVHGLIDHWIDFDGVVGPGVRLHPVFVEFIFSLFKSSASRNHLMGLELLTALLLLSVAMFRPQEEFPNDDSQSGRRLGKRLLAPNHYITGTSEKGRRRTIPL
jgi:hypothetical protein